jgi:hypothetical protein
VPLDGEKEERDPMGTVDRLMMSGVEKTKRIAYLKKKVKRFLTVENSR